MDFDLTILFNSALTFAAVYLLIWSIFRIPVQQEVAMNRRIALALGVGTRKTAFETPLLRHLLGLSMPLVKRFPFLREQIRQSLDAAGNPNGYSVDEYLALCVTSGIVLGLGAFAALLALGQFAWESLLVVPLIGAWIPYYTLKGEATKRVRLIARQLPYTLDLIALTMEAGSTFTEAIDTLIRDNPNDEFNRELRLVKSEMEFGTQRAAALKNMADRITLDSLRSVVGAVNQAEALGTPLALILKNQSQMIRMLRSVKAEEASANASMRLLLPSMIILAACCLVALAPALMRFLDGRSIF